MANADASNLWINKIMKQNQLVCPCLYVHTLVVHFIEHFCVIKVVNSLNQPTYHHTKEWKCNDMPSIMQRLKNKCHDRWPHNTSSHMKRNTWFKIDFIGFFPQLSCIWNLKGVEFSQKFVKLYRKYILIWWNKYD